MSNYIFGYSTSPDGAKRRAKVKASKYSIAFAKFNRWASQQHNDVYLHDVSTVPA